MTTAIQPEGNHYHLQATNRGIGATGERKASRAAYRSRRKFRVPLVACLTSLMLLGSATQSRAQSAQVDQAEAAKQMEATRQDGLKRAQEAMDAGNYDRAIELLNLIIQGWPDDATAKALLSKAHQAKGDTGPYDVAIKDAETALAAADYDKAIASAKEALKERPGDKRASDILLRAHLRQEAAKPAPVVEVPPAQPAQPAQPPPVVPPPPVEGTNAPAITPENAKPEQKPRNHEVAVSGDFFLGKGNVTMPFGFALSHVDVFSGITPTVAKPDRSSDYFGSTISYGYKPWALYLDLQYSHGDSSGNANVQLGDPNANPPLPSQFSIKDDWFQAYVRYTFPRLRFTPFNAYLRAGGSFVKAELNDSTVIPVLGLYTQADSTKDYLGNLGAGAGYSWSGERFRIGVQVEAEGFYGQRSQSSREDLPQAELGFQPTASINNTLYGGIARGTVRVQYGFGRTQFLKAFLEGGMQGKFTEIQYSSEGNFKGGTFNELLWGPYVKVGLRFLFL